MNSIVIVEDRLKRAISLAEQFERYASEFPELELQVLGICYFCSDSKLADAEIRKAKDQNIKFPIKHISLLDFKETLDSYLRDPSKRCFLIMDYILEDDGSDGIPMHRVNIRYARDKERYKTDRLWFYTGTGRKNEEVLGQLIGKEHLLEVKSVDDNELQLELQNPNFEKALASERATDHRAKENTTVYTIQKKVGSDQSIVAVIKSDTIIEPLDIIKRRGIKGNETYILSYVEENGDIRYLQYGINEYGQLACIREWMKKN